MDPSPSHPSGGRRPNRKGKPGPRSEPLQLVTFLGKGHEKDQSRYRTVNYQFNNGSLETTPFFGLALARHLNPDTLIILGTAGSMWDVLIEHLAAADDPEDVRLELIDAVESADISQSLLDRVAPLAERALGCTLRLRLIPYAREDSEQIAVLQDLAEVLKRGRVSFDLTHAFRHLGMLGLVSAFFLERTGKLKVDGLYYGALDMTRDGITPVLRLDGLIFIQRWVAAMDHFDATGDYGAFAPLLEQDGVPTDIAACLEAAAFHERTFNLRDAKRKLQTFLPCLNAPLPGASGLFQKRLSDRLHWAREAALQDNQRTLAYTYLARRDYVRTAVLAWEAIITRECAEHGLDENDFEENGHRDRAEKLLKDRLRAEGERWSDSPHRRLKDLRNALAHGNPPRVTELCGVLSDPERLHKTLEADIKRALD